MKTRLGTDVLEAAEILKHGGLVAIPTETVYGLAGNALDKEAVAKIFSAKNRPAFDPLICHLKNVEDISDYALHFPDELRAFLETYSPGPVTVILPKKEIIPFITTAGLDSAAFRIPRHPMTQALLQQLDFPLAAPSANPFGYVSPTRAEHVMEQLEGKVDYILDGGPCEVGIESTIVEYRANKLIVHRLGGLSLETIRDHFKEVEIRNQSTSNPKAPGQLSSHYAPRKPLMLGELSELLKRNSKARPALICFEKKLEGYDESSQFVLSESGSTVEAAQKIFGLLRDLDKSDFEIILAEPMPETGLGPAINDRLKRASSSS